MKTHLRVLVFAAVSLIEFKFVLELIQKCETIP